MRSRVLCFALAAAAFATWSPRPARACTPLPIYTTTLVSSDAPACLVVTLHDGDAPYVNVKNDCAGDVTISSGDDCPSCDPELALPPGETAPYTVHTEEEGARRTVRWSTDEAAGTIVLDVAYDANEDGCDEYNEENDDGDGDSGDGCSVATPAQGHDGAAAIAALGALGLIAARRGRSRRRA